MIDHFTTRLPGVQIDQTSKKFYYDFYDCVVRGRLPTGSLGLVEEFRFLRRFTEHRTKVSVTGPLSLVKRIRNEYYPSEEALALDIARVMNVELRELVRAGATDIQVDEPYYSGFPEDLPWAVRALNALVEGVGARLSLHVCYGNRYGKPSWEGSYRYLFPAILEARIHQLTLEFARRGEDDVRLFKDFDPQFTLGLGVVDVKSHDIETPGRRRRADPDRPRARARQGARRQPRLRPDAPAARRRLREAQRDGGGHAARAGGARRLSPGPLRRAWRLRHEVAAARRDDRGRDEYIGFE